MTKQTKTTWTTDYGTYVATAGPRFTRIVFTDRHGAKEPAYLLPNGHVESWRVNHEKRQASK